MDGESGEERRTVGRAFVSSAKRRTETLSRADSHLRVSKDVFTHESGGWSDNAMDVITVKTGLSAATVVRCPVRIVRRLMSGP